MYTINTTKNNSANGQNCLNTVKNPEKPEKSRNMTIVRNKYHKITKLYPPTQDQICNIQKCKVKYDTILLFNKTVNAFLIIQYSTLSTQNVLVFFLIFHKNEIART